MEVPVLFYDQYTSRFTSDGINKNAGNNTALPLLFLPPSVKDWRICSVKNERLLFQCGRSMTDWRGGERLNSCVRIRADVLSVNVTLCLFPDHVVWKFAHFLYIQEVYKLFSSIDISLWMRKARDNIFFIKKNKYFLLVNVMLRGYCLFWRQKTGLCTGTGSENVVGSLHPAVATYCVFWFVG